MSLASLTQPINNGLAAMNAQVIRTAADTSAEDLALGANSTYNAAALEGPGVTAEMLQMGNEVGQNRGSFVANYVPSKSGPTTGYTR